MLLCIGNVIRNAKRFGFVVPAMNEPLGGLADVMMGIVEERADQRGNLVRVEVLGFIELIDRPLSDDISRVGKRLNQNGSSIGWEEAREIVQGGPHHVRRFVPKILLDLIADIGISDVFESANSFFQNHWPTVMEV